MSEIYEICLENLSAWDDSGALHDTKYTLIFHPNNPIEKLLKSHVRKISQWDPDNIAHPAVFSVSKYYCKDDLIILFGENIPEQIHLRCPHELVRIACYMTVRDGITTTLVDCADFQTMLDSVRLEEITPGRKSAILAKFVNDAWYVVRSTTCYKEYPQKINEIHKFRLLSNSNQESNYNNIMVELYDDRYRTMQYHTDLSLDLSHSIHILSLYPKEEKRRRELYFYNKESGEKFVITLEDKMLVSFDVKTNARYSHKIVGTATWLGLTYRKSHTLSSELRLAKEHEIKNFLLLRKKENTYVNFKYPDIPYTLCQTDILSVPLCE